MNPEIILTEGSAKGEEGCLSIPNLVGEVERHAAIQVKGLNRHGKPMKIKAEGWLARIFQHEIDHLNGTLYLDRMYSRSFCSVENLGRLWNDVPAEVVRKRLRW